MEDGPRRPKPKAFADAEVVPKKKRAQPQRYSNPNYGRYKRSKKHEDRIAEALHGKRLPRSGGLSWSKWDKAKTAGGDVKIPDFLVEHKRTVNESISIKKDWLAKVTEGAHSSMLEPALIVTFEVAGSTQAPEDWVMVPMAVFQRLTKKDDESDG